MFLHVVVKAFNNKEIVISKQQINAAHHQLPAFICGIDCQPVALTISYSCCFLLIALPAFYYTTSIKKPGKKTSLFFTNN
jgi:hypothetical protein